MWTVANIISLIVGIGFGITIFICIYLKRIKNKIEKIINPNKDKLDDSMINIIKYYKKTKKYRKKIGIIPLKTNRDMSELNLKFLQIDDNNLVKIPDLLLLILKNTSEKYNPKSKNPILELTIDELHDAINHLVYQVNRALDNTTLDIIKYLKVNQLRYLYSIYKFSKKIKLKEWILLLKLLLMIINIFGLAFWIKKLSNKLVVTSIGELLMLLLFELSYYEIDYIYKPKN